MCVVLLLKRNLNEDFELLQVSKCLDRWAVQNLPVKELSQGSGEHVSAGENSCNLNNLTWKKRECCFPSRSFGSHSLFCGYNIIFVSKGPGKAAFAKRQLETTLRNETKIDPEVCTSPGRLQASGSHLAGLAMGLLRALTAGGPHSAAPLCSLKMPPGLRTHRARLPPDETSKKK